MQHDFFFHSANQIIDLWRRQILNSLLGARASEEEYVKLSTKIQEHFHVTNTWSTTWTNERKSRRESAYIIKSKQILPSNDKAIREVQMELVNNSDKTARVKVSK